MERGAATPGSPITPRRVHLARLRQIWRSGGWPCRDAIEIDLLAANWVTLAVADGGVETLRLTDSGIRVLASARQSNQRALSAHDRLAQRVAQQLAQSGRIVWRELSLRAQVTADAAPPDGVCSEPEAPGWCTAEPDVGAGRSGPAAARPSPCTLPFAVWIALARSSPLSFDGEGAQGHLGGPGLDDKPGALPDE